MSRVQPPISDRSILILSFVTAVNIVPHLVDLPLWICIAAVACLAWRSLSILGYGPMPSAWLRTAINIACFVAVFLTFQTPFSRDLGASYFMLAASLKILQLKGYRDGVMVVMLNYFLLMAKLMVEQTFEISVFLVFDVLLITAALYHIGHGGRDRLPLKTTAKALVRTGLAAAPFVVGLFFIFPRFNIGLIPLAGAPQDVSGFSDQLRPGDIAGMIESDKIAFRARILTSASLTMEDLYWRGKILWLSEGLHWSRDLQLGATRVGRLPLKNEEVITTEVMLEPRFGQTLFGLDRPNNMVFRDRFRQALLEREVGQIFSFKRPNDQRLLYWVDSAGTSEPRLARDEAFVFRQTPARVSERVRDLVASWQAKGSDAETLVGEAMNFFKAEGFRYTLEPGRLGGDQLDEFLFERKLGFCEHYAGAVATLMRLAGLPSRVVLGFQGGEYNGFDDYYIIRDKDAHAWAEVWSEGKGGWMRVDPVTVVAPLRLSLGGQAYHLGGADAAQTGGDAGNQWFWQVFSKNFAMFFDSLAHSWNMFLLEFDYDYQVEMLKALGVELSDMATLLLAAVIIILALGLSLVLRERLRRATRDPIVKQYESFLRAMARRGLPKEASEGPLRYAERLRAHLPEARTELDRFHDIYVALRYAGESTRGGAAELKFARRELIRRLARTRKDQEGYRAA